MPAPTVTTSAATVLGPTLARLNGTVSPGGLSTDYWFERFRDDWQAAGEPSRTNFWPNPYGAGLSKAGLLESNLEVLEAVNLPDLTGLPAGITTGFRVKASAANARVYIETLVTAGQTYRYSVWFRNKAAAEGAEPLANLRISKTAGGEVVAQSGFFTTKVEGEYIRYDLSWTADATTIRFFRIQTVGSWDYYVTACLIEQSAALGSYFPRPHELTSGQAVWTGAELESPSTRATPTNIPIFKNGDAGEGEAAVEVRRETAALVAETEYHARTYASNASGEAWGEDKTFLTGAPAVLGALGSIGVPLSHRNRIVNP